MRTSIRPALAALAALALAGAAPARRGAFTDITAKSGLRIQHETDLVSAKTIATMSGGLAFGDYDLDGNLDLAVAGTVRRLAKEKENTQCTALWRGRGDGTFEDVTARARLSVCGWGMGVTWADWNNDNWPDLYVTQVGGNHLLRNRGDGTFEDVTARAGVAVGRWSAGSVFLDYDRDGDLDLYVANYLDTTPARENLDSLANLKTPEDYAAQANVLFRNDGGGAFTDVTTQAGVADRGGKSLGVFAFDYNGDGWTDIYVANDRVRGALFRNEKNGAFKDVALAVGTAYNRDGRPTSGMGVAVGDYDRDGDQDVFMTNFADETNTLYRNEGGRLYRDVTPASGLGPSSLDYVGWGTTFFDYDNDGWLDVYVNNGNLMPGWVVKAAKLFQNKARKYDVGKGFEQVPLFYRNNGNGTFRHLVPPETGDLGRKKFIGRGSAAGDVDNDGDVDLVLFSQGDTTTLYRNELGTGKHWIAITPLGDRARTAFGTKVRVTAGGATQHAEYGNVTSYCSGSLVPLHFGLGTAKSADRIEIDWPEGKTDVLNSVAADRAIRVTRGGKITP